MALEKRIQDVATELQGLNGILHQIDEDHGVVKAETRDVYYGKYDTLADRNAMDALSDVETSRRILEAHAHSQNAFLEAVKGKYSTVLAEITDVQKLALLAISIDPKKIEGKDKHNAIVKAISQYRAFASSLDKNSPNYGNLAPYLALVKNKRVLASLQQADKEHLIRSWAPQRLQAEENKVLELFAGKDGKLDANKLRSYLATTESKYSDGERIGLYARTVGEAMSKKK